METIKQHFTEAQATLTEFMSNEHNFAALEEAGLLMVKALKNGKKIIACGNGGSMCVAMHFAEGLSGRYRNDRKALAAISISDPSYLSCMGEDYGYAYIFSRFIEAVGQKGDVLLGISASGNSENIINAINVAREKGMNVVGLTGKDEEEIAKLCDVEVRAPQSLYADRTMEIHLKCIHALIDFIEGHVGRSL